MANIVEEPLDSLESLDLNEKENEKSFSNPNCQKVPYKDRKLEHKLKKYEAMIKKLENVNRVAERTQVICNKIKNILF